MPPRFLIYASDPVRGGVIRRHLCATDEIAEAVTAYIAARYGQVPLSADAVEQVILDPGGAVFGAGQPCVVAHLGSYEVKVHPSHISAVLADIAAREGKVHQYGAVECWRMGCMYGLAVLPAGHETRLAALLAPYMAEGDAVRDQAMEALRDGPVILPKSRQIPSA